MHMDNYNAADSAGSTVWIWDARPLKIKTHGNAHLKPLRVVLLLKGRKKEIMQTIKSNNRKHF